MILKKKTPGIFDDPSKTFIDLYMKIFRMRPFNSKDCLCFRLVLMFVLFVSFDVLAHSQTDIGKQDITHFYSQGIQTL